MQLTPILIEELVELLFVDSCSGRLDKVPHRVGEEVISCCIYSPVV